MNSNRYRPGAPSPKSISSKEILAVTRSKIGGILTLRWKLKKACLAYLKFHRREKPRSLKFARRRTVVDVRKITGLTNDDFVDYRQVVQSWCRLNQVEIETFEIRVTLEVRVSRGA